MLYTAESPPKIQSLKTSCVEDVLITLPFPISEAPFGELPTGRAMERAVADNFQTQCGWVQYSIAADELAESWCRLCRHAIPVSSSCKEANQAVLVC
ncbi:hypothetical protein IAQ61_009659 [Plenodomus lingam]|uniref:uncharacterized protein n=1 Tax=Leptosphaeria maculans TaxID=5022 RepID=UPI00331D2B89|nr:hypothetical protein IAQ61_009659 [Plenodomus lingam]